MLAREGLTVVRGSVEDQTAMCAVFSAADAVISCLGATMSLRILVKGTDFQRRTLPVIVSAINEAGVKRFVLVSSFGVGETAAKASIVTRILFYSVIAKQLFDDKVIAERSLSDCKANWTAVYPVTLAKRPAIAVDELLALNEVRKVPGMPVLPFANVAKTLFGLVSDESQAGQKLLQTVPGGWR